MKVCEQDEVIEIREHDHWNSVRILTVLMSICTNGINLRRLKENMLSNNASDFPKILRIDGAKMW